MTVTDELQRLKQLHEAGDLSDDEFGLAKAKLLNEPLPAGDSARDRHANAAEQDRECRQWALILHLSQFAGYLVPLAGLIVPIVIWQIKKDEFPEIDDHGKMVVNWIISEVIYLVIGVLLAFVVIGVPLLIALGVVSIVFPVIGALKANNGELWRYPMSFEFLK